MLDFDQTMEKAATIFVSDVIESGKEKITVRIEDGDCYVDIGRAGGLMRPIEFFSGESTGEIIAGFVMLIIATSNESNDNLNFKLTKKEDSIHVVEVTKVMH